MNGSKKKFFINLVVAAILVVSSSYFIVEYLTMEIEKSSAKIVEDKKIIHTLSNKNGQIDNARKDYKDIQTKTDEASKSIIDKDKTVDFIEEVEGIAGENRVKHNIVKKVTEKTDKGASGFISSSDFNFQIAGNFDSVMRFLYSLENFKYDVDISNVRMNFGDFDEYNKDMIILTFDLKLYQKDITK